MVYRKASYNPLNDLTYMSSEMKQYFQNKLHQELENLLEEERTLSLSLLENINSEPDFVDQSAIAQVRFNSYAFQKHETYLRHAVESALRRLADNTYGYCAATGKPIGVERLMAAPYAVYCVDIQAEKECYGPNQWA